MSDGLRKRPDATEYGIRFGCGALFGVFYGVYLVVPGLFHFRSGTYFIVAIAIVAIVCGVLAARMGDRFWSGLFRR